nr:PREDICTED: ankyrin repeat domain-containing protein 40 isoform X1 [Tribolium castaneum]|eukprot:XP_008196494.1 PREDICTED: ankyrin repeat domain-containing protein 40 isoform X1 [Tribolium castaneum]
MSRAVGYVLRLRVANLEDKDFIEVDYDESKLNYRDLIETCCQHLGVDKIDVAKIRKLPDVTIRRDEDVQRFNRLEHLEVVVVPSRLQPSYNYQL